MSMVVDGLQVDLAMRDKHLIYVPNAPYFQTYKEQQVWNDRVRLYVHGQVSALLPHVNPYHFMYIPKYMVDHDTGDYMDSVRPPYAVVTRDALSYVDPEVLEAFDVLARPNHYLVCFMRSFGNPPEKVDVIGDVCWRLPWILVFFVVFICFLALQEKTEKQI